MINISWDRYYRDTHALGEKIRQSGVEYDKMLCIARGGVFIGGLLAHYLGMRDLTTIALRLYDHAVPGQQVTEISSPDLPKASSRILVVDDLLDSGRTVAYIMGKWSGFHNIDLAVLYDKGGGDYRPDYYAEITPNEWIVFPWELPEGE